MPETIQLASSFALPVPPDHAFSVVTDAEQLVDVVPGAILTSWDGVRFTATVRLRVGLLPLVGHGTGRIRTRDHLARHAVVDVARRDGRHVGTVTITVSADGQHSTVSVHADLLAPRAAGRFGRTVVTDVGHRLFAEAGTALAVKLAATPATPAVAGDAAADDPVAPASSDESAGVPRSVPPALGRPPSAAGAAGAAVATAATVTAGVALAVVRRVLRHR